MVDGVKAVEDGQEPERPQEDGLLHAEERVRRYLELYPYPSIGSEILYDDAFKSDEWPRRAYPLNRDDLLEVLRDLEIYEDELSKANARSVRDAKRIARLEKTVDRLEKLVASMRLNGARHWFCFAYDKYVEEAGKRLQFCRDCDKEKDHPTHFAQGARYLDSRKVEEAAKAAQERLCNLLEDGMKLNARTALNTARELLRGLPGIGDFQEVPGRPEVRE